MDIMTQVTRNTWENRYRDEFDKALRKVVTIAKDRGVVGSAKSYLSDK